jgi:S1-C subfamily serine protease
MSSAALFVGEGVCNAGCDRHWGWARAPAEGGWKPLGSFFCTVLRILLALPLVPCHADADPALSSVWIDVQREAGLRFNGHRLPREAAGMGVVITHTREIATAAHVVWQARSITISDSKGAKVPARVLCIDKTVDAALLRVEHPFEHVATIRARPAVTGEKAVVVERPTSEEAPHIASAAIGAARWTSNGVPVPLIFSGIKGEKGMSGGGLFDASGALLGIVIRIDGTLGYLSALPVTELCTRFTRCAGGVQPPALLQACGPAASLRDTEPPEAAARMKVVQ